MPESKGRHLDLEDRLVVEEGLGSGLSARALSRRLHISASTVTREIRNNKTVKVPVRKGAKPSTRCSNYNECQRSGDACEKCSTRLTACKHCKTRACVDSCNAFTLKMCPKTEAWPYICPTDCRKRPNCSYPKCSYRAESAQRLYEKRLSESRAGFDITPEELEAAMKIIKPLVEKGQSFEAIWANHSDELPVCVRTFYNYTDAGFVDIANIELPRKVRCRPRAHKGKKGQGRSRIDRTGRTYDDFKELSLSDQARVVQADSVEGYGWNTQRILSLGLVRFLFQFYILQPDGSALSTVKAFDAIEAYLGSCEAFELLMGIVLADRGCEFDDWEGMERSALSPGQRRCRVFYCDPMETNQKSQCERNHVELRRILPKKRSDFDKLTFSDVALATSHVNSYPRPKFGGKCPFELALPVLPDNLLDNLGIERVAPDDVTLKPYLLAHAVKQ